MARVAVVFGTRPEAIKMCPLVRELKRQRGVEVLTCVTGQHRELLDGAMEAFGVRADVDLCAMREGQSLSELTTALVSGLDRVMHTHRPDAVLVHGDTCSAFSAALAAFYRGIAVYHVEAGLRTYDIRSPFPEEFFRRAISLVADIHFSPTDTARENLLSEGVPEQNIFVVGNTVTDALGYTLREDYSHELLDWAGNNRLVLMTAHRRENLGDAMENIFRGVRRVLDTHKDVRVIYPVHPNPPVRRTAERILGGCEGVRLTEPLEVTDFHNMLSRAYMAVTDSGGIQEEACALGVPTLVARNTTERGEGVSTGGIRLIGTCESEVSREIARLLDDSGAYEKMRFSANPYGNGTSSAQICQILRQKLALFTEL